MRLQNLKWLRKHTGKTLAHLASQLGYSVSYLSEVERGLKVPSLDFLYTLASAFEVETSWVVRLMEIPSEDVAQAIEARLTSAPALDQGVIDDMEREAKEGTAFSWITDEERKAAKEALSW